MAFVDVEIPEEQSSGSYFKFDAIGASLTGTLVSKGMGPAGQYGSKMEYVFRARLADGSIGNQIVSPPTKLAYALENAAGKGQSIQPGDQAVMKYTKDLPPPPDKPTHSPTKMFAVQYRSAAQAKIDAASKAAPKPPPPPPPPAGNSGEFDDIPL